MSEIDFLVKLLDFCCEYDHSRALPGFVVSIETENPPSLGKQEIAKEGIFKSFRTPTDLPKNQKRN